MKLTQEQKDMLDGKYGKWWNTDMIRSLALH